MDGYIVKIQFASCSVFRRRFCNPFRPRLYFVRLPCVFIAPDKEIEFGIILSGWRISEMSREALRFFFGEGK